MSPLPRRDSNVLMLPALWGLDTALAALCWAICATQCMQITMVEDEPILLLTACVWLCTLFMRVRNAIQRREQPCREYYESRIIPMLVLAGCVSAVCIRMLLYDVGRDVLPYACIPLLFLLPFLNPLRQDSRFTRLCQSLALGFACLAPAYSMSFGMSPLHMLYSVPCWCVGLLFFFFQQERVRKTEDGCTFERPFCFLIIVNLCTRIVGIESGFECTMTFTTFMGAACLFLLIKLRPLLSERSFFCLCWPLMTLPALLSLLIFRP